MQVTPEFQIPYLTAEDKGDDWPPYYKKLADRLEAVIHQQFGGGTGKLVYASAQMKKMDIPTGTAAPAELDVVKMSADFTVAGSLITVTKAGLYQVNTSAQVKGSAVTAMTKMPKIEMSMKVGGQNTYGWVSATDGGQFNVTYIAPFLLAAGDTIQVLFKKENVAESRPDNLSNGFVTVLRLDDAA
ncbi:hypothetical protein [Streptomyces sp. NPDC057302]|uniref:hypothetical protein n=1 Tax=Streptomyces sp. NPDC057302 TaxID=3346094 RepID=UPI0036403882